MQIHQKNIDDIPYTTKTLAATTGLVLLPRLISLFGESLLRGFFISNHEERRALFEDPAVVANIVANIAQNAADGDKLLVLKDLLVNTTCSQLKIGETESNEGSVCTHFDTHFQARYKHLVSVAMWVASVNFLEP